MIYRELYRRLGANHTRAFLKENLLTAVQGLEAADGEVDRLGKLEVHALREEAGEEERAAEQLDLLRAQEHGAEVEATRAGACSMECLT